MLKKGYEDIRRYQLNPILLKWCLALSKSVKLKDSAAAKSYREQYPKPMARRSPAITVVTHMTGDTFYHGPDLSEQAQYITELYGANDYMITDM